MLCFSLACAVNIDKRLLALIGTDGSGFGPGFDCERKGRVRARAMARSKVRVVLLILLRTVLVLGSSLKVNMEWPLEAYNTVHDNPFGAFHITHSLTHSLMTVEF